MECHYPEHGGTPHLELNFWMSLNCSGDMRTEAVPTLGLPICLVLYG